MFRECITYGKKSVEDGILSGHDSNIYQIRIELYCFLHLLSLVTQRCHLKGTRTVGSHRKGHSPDNKLWSWWQWVTYHNMGPTLMGFLTTHF